MIGTLNVINDPEENSQADFIIKTKPKTESKMNLKKHSEVNFENSVNTPIRSVFRSEYSDQNKPKECGNLKTIHNSRTTTEIAPRGSIRKIDFENLSQQQMPRGSTKRSEIQSTLQSKPPRPSPKPDVRSKEISLDASPDSVVISITEDKPRGLFNYPIEIDNFETDRNSKVLKIKQQSKSKIDTNISRKAHTIDALSFKISQNDTDLSSKALKDKEDELMRLYKSIASEKPKHEERRTVQTPQYSVILKEKRPEKSWFSNLFGCVERN